MAGELDMGRMREEAARRAREMQSRAHIPPPRRNSHPGEPPRAETVREEPAETHPAPEQTALSPSEEGSGSVLDAFFRDKERTIILALLILLSGEGENHELLFALLFLLL